MTSVLLVRLSAMGDLVQSLTAVGSLHRARPDWRITVVTQREWAPLLDGVSGVDAVHRFDRRGGLRAVWALRKVLRADHFDVALDLQGNWKSALVTRLSGAADTVGMANAWRQEPRSRVLLRRTIECDAPPHPARAAWELAKQTAPDAPFVHPSLCASKAEIADEQAALSLVGFDTERPFRVVVLTDERDPRALRSSWLQQLEPQMPTLWLLGPAEAAMQPPLGYVIRHGRGEVRRLVALGALVARSRGEVVGPDQGATHVLLASGATGRVFFGSQDPSRTAPPSAQAFIRTGELTCRPCRSRHCQNPKGAICMDFASHGTTPAPTHLPQ